MTKLYESWMGKPGFDIAVVKAYNSAVVRGPPDKKLLLKLKIVKEAIKSWRRELLAKERGDIDKLEQKVEELDLKAERLGLNVEEKRSRIDAKKELFNLEMATAKDLRQKARVKWMVEGDENTSFFHKSIKCNTSKSRINGLSIEGMWETDPLKIKNVILGHFKDRFNEDCPSRPSLSCSSFSRISERDSAAISAPFSEEEIKRAVWDCGVDKAPGPDGFNFRFIRHFWDLLKSDIKDAVDYFHDVGVISHGCNASFITLIPKASDPIKVSDYRPISLIGCYYKIIAKILANRIKEVMPMLIGEEQSAFLSNRFILDGPMIVNETMAWLKRRKRKAMMFKIDFEKAYDMVNWKFLVSIMEQMGFPLIWRRWILGCLNSTRTSVLVNRSPTSEFVSSRGLRQGDPLSPFLFLIVMEALHVSIKSAVNLGVFHGVKTPNEGPILSHVMFADDVLILGDWSLSNGKNLARILRCFNVASGLKTNFWKSTVFGVGVDQDDLGRMAEVIHCQHSLGPFNLLGIPIGANMNRAENWKPVVDKFKTRLSSWKSRSLSFGGRLTLTKAVLGSLPAYFMAMYKAPGKVIDALERIRRGFFWGGTSTEKKLPWVAWNKLVASRKVGGLGIGNLRDFNLASLAKWKWRLLTSGNELWAKTIKAIHFQPRKIASIPFNGVFSGAWKHVMNADKEMCKKDPSLKNLVLSEVGEGGETYFWLDNWVGGSPLKDQFPDLYAVDTLKSCKVNMRVSFLGSGASFQWDWKRPPTENDELNQVTALENLISGMQPKEGVDTWKWIGDSSGEFSVAALRKCMELSRMPVDLEPFLWSKWIPLKVNVFAWRAGMDALASKEALSRRGIHIELNECSLCFGNVESTNHIFFSCPYAGSVWSCIAAWCRKDKPGDCSPKVFISNPFGVSSKDRMHKVYRSIVLAACWSIWGARNNLIFNNRLISVSNVVDEIIYSSFSWLRRRAKMGCLDWKDWCNFDCGSFPL